LVRPGLYNYDIYAFYLKECKLQIEEMKKANETAMLKKEELDKLII
jgi:hypothetical protein